MPTVLLVRHGRTTANAAGVLAGRADGVRLDDVGRQQATDAATRLAAVPLAIVASSPLERCRETAEAIVTAQVTAPSVPLEPGITECDYGRWQGRPLTDLAREPLWRVVQDTPSEATFPDGESMPAMQARAVEAIGRLDASVRAEHGDGAVWAAVSHGDVIKALLADALGMPLDRFQRLHVDPASISIVRLGASRPQVLGVNTLAGALAWLRPGPGGASGADAADAVVGGGAGPRGGRS